jgi:hypothetical protein
VFEQQHAEQLARSEYDVVGQVVDAGGQVSIELALYELIAVLLGFGPCTDAEQRYGCASRSSG